MPETDIPTEDAAPVVDWRALRDLVSDDTGEHNRRRRSVALTVAIVAWIGAFVLVWITWDQVASRDVVADCFEIGHYAHHGDAMIVISGCDKTGAAALMPLARTNAFGLVLYPGTGTPGWGWASGSMSLIAVVAVRGS